MSYREENGQVVLTMSRPDYEHVLMIFGMATGIALTQETIFGVEAILRLLNTLNEGNPNYTPYEVKS
jgi:hypothetical protein